MWVSFRGVDGSSVLWRAGVKFLKPEGVFMMRLMFSMVAAGLFVGMSFASLSVADEAAASMPTSMPMKHCGACCKDGKCCAKCTDEKCGDCCKVMPPMSCCPAK